MKNTESRPPAPRTSRGRQLEAMVLEILGAFFDLRTRGQEEGLVTQSGAGSWGLLRLLKEDGPKTVPEVARIRAVSRQYIQKLADELMADGLVETFENPAHRRSKRLRLTPAGERRFDEMTSRFSDSMERLAEGFRLADLRTATETIARLRERLGPDS